MIPRGITADPQTLGAQYRLGTHKATYKQSTFEFVLSVVAYWIVIIGGILFFYWTFTYLSPDWRLRIFAMGALALAVGLLLALSNLYQDRVKRVLIYEYGMIHVGRDLLQTIIYWKDVQSVIHNVTVHNDGNGNTSVSHTYTVNCTDGTSLKLAGTFGKETLGRSIENATAHNLFPGVLDTYRRNGAVIFGSLTVTPQGLYHGSNLLPWDELKKIQISTDIVIRKKRKLFSWASVKMANVPNVEVFRMLIHHITGVRP